jgi:glyoxylate reductase
MITLLTDRIDAEILGQGGPLRAISNYAVGLDNIDLMAARRRGIAVGHTPEVLTDATAELTLALLLAVARCLPSALHAARHDWLTWEPAALLGLQLSGSRMLIIGPGRIGGAVARRAEAFGMHVSSLGREELAAGELQARLSEADVVSLHCPLTAATRHLIDSEALRGMRPDAILLNTARGELVDSVALADALLSGTIAGAGLDVSDPEPLPAAHPLWQAPHLILTPHIGSATRMARERMTELAVCNLLAALAGEQMPNPAPAP